VLGASGNHGGGQKRGNGECVRVRKRKKARKCTLNVSGIQGRNGAGLQPQVWEGGVGKADKKKGGGAKEEHIVLGGKTSLIWRFRWSAGSSAIFGLGGKGGEKREKRGKNRRKPGGGHSVKDIKIR